ncbi:uncharacterized protein [Dysidea avara]|uniref:uncharacterized protein isoform X3 n=1 Tax=Dysidea avara TaxID=196820 RepID=UPI0033284462
MMRNLTSETVFLLTTFVNMASACAGNSAEEVEFINKVASEIFKCTQLVEFARDAYSDTGSMLLDSIAIIHPTVISTLVQKTRDNIGGAGKHDAPSLKAQCGQYSNATTIKGAAFNRGNTVFCNKVEIMCAQIFVFLKHSTTSCRLLAYSSCHQESYHLSGTQECTQGDSCIPLSRVYTSGLLLTYEAVNNCQGHNQMT